jgi:hypothetical protein
MLNRAADFSHPLQVERVVSRRKNGGRRKAQDEAIERLLSGGSFRAGRDGYGGRYGTRIARKFQLEDPCAADWL